MPNLVNPFRFLSEGSPDGQDLMVGGEASTLFYYSDDYGATINQLSSVLDGNTLTGMCMTGTGQYRYISQRTSFSKLDYSDDYGVTWSTLETSPAIGWKDIACSSTGQYMVGCKTGNQSYQIQVSDDYGATWTEYGTIGGWSHCAVSANGEYMLKVEGGIGSSGLLYLSDDFGVTWTDSGAERREFALCSPAISQDGEYMAAVRIDGKIYWSDDFGATWADKTAGLIDLKSIDMSNSGEYVLVSQDIGGLAYNWMSDDFGATWSTTDVIDAYSHCAMNGTGEYMYTIKADVSGENIRVSDDYGATWADGVSMNEVNFLETNKQIII